MTYKATPHVDRSLDLQEYIEFVRREVDILDIESLRETSWALKALSNHGADVRRAVNEGLRLFIDKPEEQFIFTPHSVMLAKCPGFVVRANLWVRPATDPAMAELEVPLFSYETPHDHNFHLVTVGHVGSGYETELYQYDNTNVVGYPGEPVHLIPCGRERLAKGDVMVYESGVDIHRQLFPEEPSISINLLINHEVLNARPQYLFDVDAGRISRYFADDQIYARSSLIGFARHLHDERTKELLLAIGQRHDCHRTRAHALIALQQACPDETDYVTSIAGADRRQATRTYFEAMLSHGRQGIEGRALMQPVLEKENPTNGH